MAITSKVPYKTNPSVELEVEKLEEEVYNETVNICSLMDAKVLITGTVTGTQYVFARAGTVVAVDKRDADEILNKKKGRACCGGNSGTPLFQLA